MRLLAEVNQLRFVKERELVLKTCEIIRLVPETDVWVFDDGEDGWHAVVGAEGNFFIFYGGNERIRAVTHQLARGFYLSGAPRIDLELEKRKFEEAIPPWA